MYVTIFCIQLICPMAPWSAIKEPVKSGSQYSHSLKLVSGLGVEVGSTPRPFSFW